MIARPKSQLGEKLVQLSEDRAHYAIAAVLRYGSLVSTVIMALGLVLILLHRPADLPSLGSPTPIGVLLARALRLDAPAISEFGLLLLLLTPILRIIVAATTFGLERDHKYMFIALGVLTVVILSLALAMG
jgi:uncharacterized membrane protein